jgi:hypothetical protein
MGVSPATMTKAAISYLQSTGRSKVAAPPQDIRPQWRIGHAATILRKQTRFCVAALQHLWYEKCMFSAAESGMALGGADPERL